VARATIETERNELRVQLAQKTAELEGLKTAITTMNELRELLRTETARAARAEAQVAEKASRIKEYKQADADASEPAVSRASTLVRSGVGQSTAADGGNLMFLPVRPISSVGKSKARRCDWCWMLGGLFVAMNVCGV
jgi:hypothetical protein